MVCMIALILGGEYLFAIVGIFQMRHRYTLRGGSSRQYAEANLLLEKKMNNTVEFLISKLQDQSVNDERLMSLEKRLKSLAETLGPSDTEGASDAKGELEKLRNTIERVEEQVQKHEAKVRRMNVGSLRQRLSSVEERVQSLKRSRNERSDDEDTKSTPFRESNDPFCVPWELNTDDWWTHHPDWYVSGENNTHYCFSPIEDRKKAAVFRRLYDVQFNGDCSNITTKRMWSSGFGADFQNVVDGLVNAYHTGIPTQMYVAEGAWHYAGKKDASRPVCESKDMYCFFLNMTKCEANPEQEYDGSFITAENIELHEGIGRWLLEYATRQQTWLRREVYEFSKKVEIQTPCTVMHVRRTDIVLHGEWSRKYRQIKEYITALDNSTKNILLLTDDQNAIEEAQTLHPDYHWMFIERPRHRGAEGGWENQIPSDDPKLEMIVLLSVFRLVRQCTSFIHTHSNFAFLLEGEMQDAHKDEDLHLVNLDDDNPNLWNANNSLTVNLSTSFT